MTLDQVFVRRARAHTKNLPLKVDERRVDDLPNGQIYYGLKNDQHMTSKAEERMELFTLDEQAEELRINNQKRILTYKVLDTSTPDHPSSQRKLFERIKNGTMTKELSEQAEKKMRISLDEERELLRKRYLDVLDPDLMVYVEEMQSATERIREDFRKEIAALKELPGKCVEEHRQIVAANGQTRGVAILHLPEYGYEIRQTFSSGKFQSLEDLLTSFQLKPRVS